MGRGKDHLFEACERHHYEKHRTSPRKEEQGRKSSKFKLKIVDRQA